MQIKGIITKRVKIKISNRFEKKILVILPYGYLQPYISTPALGAGERCTEFSSLSTANSAHLHSLISERGRSTPRIMEHTETCRILDEPTGTTPDNSDANISFFSQTPRELANSGMIYDVNENPMDEAAMNEIHQECDKHMNVNNGNPIELNHENMNLYNSIFENQSSQASYSLPSSRAHPSPGTASTLTVETETFRRSQAAATQSTSLRKTKVKGVSEEEAALLARDDTELSDKELQLKRKAQNRLAQRAFRERKETRMKELELKLTQSEDEKKRLLDQLDLIRKHNLNMQSENERLRSLASLTAAEHPDTKPPSGFSFAFPSTQEDFVHNLVGNAHEIDTNNINRVYEIPQEPGEKILAVGAVWDYLVRMAEDLDKDIDVIEIMEKLKGHERCHGYGPAYPLKLVQEVAERCSSS